MYMESGAPARLERIGPHLALHRPGNVLYDNEIHGGLE
jgi:hypothetical protein